MLRQAASQGDFDGGREGRVPQRAATKRRRRRRSLPFVQAFRGGFRGWWMDAGVRRYTQRFASEQEAHDAAVQRRDALKRPGGGVFTLQAGIELVRKDLDARRMREGTRQWYEWQFDALLAFWEPDSRLDLCRPQDVDEFVQARLAAVSPNTVLHHLRALARIFNLGIQAGLIGSSPMARVKRPKRVEQKFRVHAWGEAKALCRGVRRTKRPKVDPRADAALLRLFLYTGLRKGEVSRLGTWDGRPVLDVDGKTGRRVLPVPPRTRVLLRRALPVTEDRIRFVFVRAGTNPHAFRHTFASELARRGVPEAVIAAVLGHSRGRSITARYLTSFGPEVARAMSLLWTGEKW